jgi:outer membrane immunogenic protein
VGTRLVASKDWTPNMKIYGAVALLFLSGAAEAQDWTGFYAGGALSYDTIEITDLTFGDGPVDISGPSPVLFAGYNFQSGNLVYSAEALVISQSGDADDGSFLRPATADGTTQLRGRIGYVYGDVLPYLAIGASRTRIKVDHEGNGNPVDSADDTASGTSVALGLDWAMNEKSFVRFEVENTSYSDDTLLFYGDDPHAYSLDATRISVGYAFRF